MSCDKKVPRQALGGELGLAGNFPPHATVITNALQSRRVGDKFGRVGDKVGAHCIVVRLRGARWWETNVTNFAPTL